MKLEDKALVRSAIRYIDEIFPKAIFEANSNANSLASVRSSLESIGTYFENGSEAPHSLFRYGSRAQRDGSENPLKSLWIQLVNSSIIVLRWHDRRENVNRGQQQYPRGEETTELAEYFFKVTDFERILYGADVWYRDHFAHVLRVWMLGIHVVYESGNEIRPPDIHPAINLKCYEKCELFAGFTVAALCHDLGYPIEKTAKLNNKIADMFGSFGGIDWTQQDYNFTPQRHELGKLLVEYLSGTVHFSDDRGEDQPLEATALIAGLEKLGDEYSNIEAKTVRELSKLQAEHLPRLRISLRSQHTYQRKYADSLESNDHGILSAMILMRKVRYFKEGEFSDTPRNFLLEEVRQYVLRREVLRACASHTCKDIYYLHPLSIESLLFFCDEIQEWGRPRFSDLYEMSPDNLGALAVELKEFSAEKISWQIDAGRVDNVSGKKWAFGLARKFRSALAGPISVFDSDGGRFQLKWELSWMPTDDRKKKSTVTFELGGSDNGDPKSPYVFKLVDENGTEETMVQDLEDRIFGR